MIDMDNNISETCTEKQIDSLWEVEAENRIDKYLAGESKTISMQDVFKEVESGCKNTTI